jgi:hypothetical protein
MPPIETIVQVVLKSGHTFRFSFNGDYSLHNYLRRQMMRVGKTHFLRVKKFELDSSEPDETMVNVDEIAVIKVLHEFSETDKG